MKRLLLLLLLAGCQGPEAAYQMAERQCIASGATASTLTGCTNSLLAERRAQSDRENAAMMQAAAILLSQGNQPPQMMPPPRQVNCFSRYNSFLRQVETFCR